MPTPERLTRGGALSALFFSLLPASGVGGGLALAPLIGGAGVGGLRPSRLAEIARRNWLFLTLFAVFVAWSLLSATWSIYPNHAQAIRTSATWISGLLFCIAATDPSARSLTRAGGIAATIMLAAFLIAEALDNMPFNRLAQPHVTDMVLLSRNPGRGATVLGVICWGAIGALLARKALVNVMLAALLVLACGWVSLQFDMQANTIGFACGLIAFAIGLALPRFAIIAATGVTALWLIVAPFVTPKLLDMAEKTGRLPDSWAERDAIWRYASARIAEHPLLGMGLDASRGFTQMTTIGIHRMRVIPLHPHSGSIQIWLETGGIGIAIATATLLIGGVALARTISSRTHAAATCGAIAAYAVSFNVSYGVWQEWWWATAFTAAALVGALAPMDAKPR